MVNKTKKNNNKGRNKTKKRKVEQSNGINKIWGYYGHVFNSKTNKYARLGGNESMRVINELEHDDEWKKRVNYIIKNHGAFGKKLETYLQKKN